MSSGKPPSSEPDGFVFCPSGGKGPVNLTRPWHAIRAEAGLPEGIGLHGLRHSLASHLAMSGAGAPEVMATMGHSQLSTVVRYIH
ncbi:MAG: tyrosine-type recombinase/integrase, partial [Afipia sp.]|nr:tyrosine-type recombinase/integrase [Afipia sp.]